jgi:hypothetical protein
MSCWDNDGPRTPFEPITVGFDVCAVLDHFGIPHREVPMTSTIRAEIAEVKPIELPSGIDTWERFVYTERDLEKK